MVCLCVWCVRVCACVCVCVRVCACVCVCAFLCVVCAVFFFSLLEYVCALFGMFCVTMYGLYWCWCLCVSLNVFVCGVCGVLCDVVWRVVLACVYHFVCLWALVVIYCVVMYGLLLCALCVFVSVRCFRVCVVCE